MLKEITKTSIFLSSLQKIQTQQCFIMKRLYKFFIESKTYKLIIKFKEGTRVNFKYSFLGRASEIKEEKNAEFLDNSRTVGYWVSWLRIKKISLSFYSSLSKIVALIKEIVKEIYRSPLQAGSIIVISAIMVNAALSFLLKREIGLFGWVMRGIFLFVGINGFLCKTDWLILKNNSAILKLTRKSAK